MISAPTGGNPKVIGSSIAMVASGPRPGRTPTSVPTSAPIERYEISAPTLITLSYMFAVSNPNTLTWIIAALLLIGGIILAVIGMMGARRTLVRGPLFITLSIIVFAVAMRPLGLVLASYLSIVAAAAATPEARWIETLVWGAVLTAFCVLLFVFGLGLPFQLWPTNLSWDSLMNLR